MNFNKLIVIFTDVLMIANINVTSVTITTNNNDPNHTIVNAVVKDSFYYCYQYDGFLSYSDYYNCTNLSGNKIRDFHAIRTLGDTKFSKVLECQDIIMRSEGNVIIIKPGKVSFPVSNGHKFTFIFSDS
jgi:hypothetical protein